MSGRKRKYVSDAREVASYRDRLRPRLSRSPLKLTKRELKQYTFKSPFPQRFSLPLSILHYVVQNPSSPIGHLKLISTCKSLARMNRILPIRRLTHNGYDPIVKWKANLRAPINLKHQFFKLWIYDQLYIRSTVKPNLASTLVKFAYKFSPRDVNVVNQVLTFGEFQILVSGGNLKFVEFDSNIIKNPDGSVTEFEKVFELLCCKSLSITFPKEEHGVGEDTTRKIIDVLSSDQIPVQQDITLWNIPENFDFRLFSDFLKTNMTGRQHSFDLSFCGGISDAYRNQLKLFVNEVIQMGEIEAHVVPVISFPGQYIYAYRKLRRMRYLSD